GTVLGQIGASGNATANHAHVVIQPDLLARTDHRPYYNAGYKVFFSQTAEETLVKTIDPVSVMLNPTMAYSIVRSDSSRQGIYANAHQYLNRQIASSGEPLIASVTPVQVPTFTDFTISAPRSQAQPNEWVGVEISAVDQNGQVYPNFIGEIRLALSSPTARYEGSAFLQNGHASLLVTDQRAGEVIVQVSNENSISEEYKLRFVNPPEVLSTDTPSVIAQPDKVVTIEVEEKQPFTDVVRGQIDDKTYEAIVTLKDAEVFQGNPDGSFGLNRPINRAEVAISLIRGFYSDIDINAIQVGRIPFGDVAREDWFAKALFFASQTSYQGLAKPAIIKGYRGKANPSGNVKLEEFLTMVLRLLEVELEQTDPWYKSALSVATELGLISVRDHQLLDQPLTRAKVAQIMVTALDLAHKGVPKLTQGQSNNREMSVKTDSIPIEQPVGDDRQTGTEPISDVSYRWINGYLRLEWKTDRPRRFVVLRDDLDVYGNVITSQIPLGDTRDITFTDSSAERGKKYRYTIRSSQMDNDLVVEVN
ncbi:MAG: S-layer homology domain-containing protein, partial [bacterium]|nr:S-layer homology domain-containing protein [bacterium]